MQGMSGYHYDPLFTVAQALRMGILPLQPSDQFAAESSQLGESGSAESVVWAIESAAENVNPDIMDIGRKLRFPMLPYVSETMIWPAESKTGVHQCRTNNVSVLLVHLRGL